MEINFQNVEHIIFFDKKAPEILPEFRHLFDQWRLGKLVSALSSLGAKSVLDLLNSLNSDHIKRLENHFGVSIIVNKLESNVTKHHAIGMEDSLCGFTEFKDFCITRNKDTTSLTFWR